MKLLIFLVVISTTEVTTVPPLKKYEGEVWLTTATRLNDSLAVVFREGTNGTTIDTIAVRFIENNQCLEKRETVVLDENPDGSYRCNSHGMLGLLAYLIILVILLTPMVFGDPGLPLEKE